MEITNLPTATASFQLVAVSVGNRFETRAERNTSLVTLNRIATALEVPLASLFQFYNEQ